MLGIVDAGGERSHRPAGAPGGDSPATRGWLLRGVWVEVAALVVLLVLLSRDLINGWLFVLGAGLFAGPKIFEWLRARH
jgi:hypothetical protein